MENENDNLMIDNDVEKLNVEENGQFLQQEFMKESSMYL